ncbi:MAG: hypothetical protein COA38_20450 [Fluviicola sp.]|nr:MAG: hypothetical protein COA38_20450 [Fluviicola sp.]
MSDPKIVAAAPPLTIKRLVFEAYTTAKATGWLEGDANCPTQQLAWLGLIHSEVSEAVKPVRVGDMDELVLELADIVIRVASMSGAMGLDLHSAVRAKLDYNRGRPRKHGKLA